MVLAAQEYVPDGHGTGGVVDVAQKWPKGHGVGAITPARQTYPGGQATWAPAGVQVNVRCGRTQQESGIVEDEVSWWDIVEKAWRRPRGRKNPNNRCAVAIELMHV